MDIKMRNSLRRSNTALASVVSFKKNRPSSALQFKDNRPASVMQREFSEALYKGIAEDQRKPMPEDGLETGEKGTLQRKTFVEWTTQPYAYSPSRLAKFKSEKKKSGEEKAKQEEVIIKGVNDGECILEAAEQAVPVSGRKRKIKEIHDVDVVNFGRKMHAWIDANDPVQGSAPGSADGIADARDDAAYFAKVPGKVYLGHLLNANLGGPGIACNLYPISPRANDEHEIGTEYYVKNSVMRHLGKACENKEEAHVEYEVEVKPDGGIAGSGGEVNGKKLGCPNAEISTCWREVDADGKWGDWRNKTFSSVIGEKELIDDDRYKIGDGRKKIIENKISGKKINVSENDKRFESFIDKNMTEAGLAKEERALKDLIRNRMEKKLSKEEQDKKIGKNEIQGTISQEIEKVLNNKEKTIDQKIDEEIDEEIRETSKGEMSEEIRNYLITEKRAKLLNKAYADELTDRVELCLGKQRTEELNGWGTAGTGEREKGDPLKVTSITSDDSLLTIGLPAKSIGYINSPQLLGVSKGQMDIVELPKRKRKPKEKTELEKVVDAEKQGNTEELTKFKESRKSIVSTEENILKRLMELKKEESNLLEKLRDLKGIDSLKKLRVEKQIELAEELKKKKIKRPRPTQEEEVSELIKQPKPSGLPSTENMELINLSNLANVEKSKLPVKGISAESKVPVFMVARMVEALTNAKSAVQDNVKGEVENILAEIVTAVEQKESSEKPEHMKN